MTPPIDERLAPPMDDGDEPAPRGVRTMAVLRWVLVAAAALLAAGSVLYHVGVRWQGPGPAASDARPYYCPMHPQVVRDGPGECPICNMSLIPQPTQPTQPTPASAAGAPDAGVGQYWCPMHPHVTSDDPNAECALCGGMKLVPRPQGTATSAGVPGLVPVMLGPDRVQLIGLQTAPVTRENLGGEVRTVAVVTADERRLAQVTARFSGFIESLPAAETGQRVKRGQILATIYSPEVLRAQQELLTALRWEGEKSASGAGHEAHGLTRGLDLDARRRLELLGVSDAEIAQVIAAGRPLTALPLRSPVNGFVVAKNAVAGAAVQAGAPLFEIADLATVWALADVYESDVARVKLRQPATLELPAYPGERFTGRVEFVSPTVDPAARTLKVRLQFRNPDRPDGPRLRPGMYGHVALALPEASALSVPREAVVDTGELQYVFVAREGGQFEPRQIQVGRSAGDRIEIRAGVREGERVVTSANFLLDSESRLRSALTGGRKP